MPKTNLGSMSVEQLLQLRDDVGKELTRKTVVLRSQLARLGGEIAPGRGRGSSLKGRKVPPKYRDSAGNIWFATETINQSCSFSTFLSDTSCGGFRTVLANWGTTIGKVAP